MADRRTTGLGADFRPARRTVVATVELGDEWVLLDEETGASFLLDSLAAILWNCFDGSSTVAQIADDVADELGADREAVRADIIELVNVMARGALFEDLPADADERSRRGLLDGARGVEVADG